jgi:hypothetical protein
MLELSWMQEWLKDIISRWRESSIPPQRIAAREQAETEAADLLDARAGKMTEAEARSLLRLMTVDWREGARRYDRFAMGFVGHLANQLVSDMDRFNYWTKALWEDDPCIRLLVHGWGKTGDEWRCGRFHSDRGGELPCPISMKCYERQSALSLKWGRPSYSRRRVTDWRHRRFAQASGKDEARRRWAGRMDRVSSASGPP